MTSPAPHLLSPAELQSSARFMRTCLLLVGSVLGAVALLNAWVDPLRVYHRGWDGQPFPNNDRYLLPGLARHEAYDTIILGTSLSASLRPALVDAAFEARTLRLTLPGGTLPEQEAVLTCALSTGQVRRVVWGLDDFVFMDSDPAATPTGTLPRDLYLPSWRTPLTYLLALDTVSESLRCLRGKGLSNLEERGNWQREMQDRFGRDQCLTNVRQLLQETKPRPASTRSGVATLAANIDRFRRLVEAHPEIEFVCVLPPVSQASCLPHLLFGGERFALRMDFRERIQQLLVRQPHCRVYDFELAFDVTGNWELYMDSSHFHQSVSDWMIEAIARDEYRVTADSIPAGQERFSNAIHELLRQAQSPGSELAGALAAQKLSFTDPRQVQLVAEPLPARR